MNVIKRKVGLEEQTKLPILILECLLLFIFTLSLLIKTMSESAILFFLCYQCHSLSQTETTLDDLGY